MAWYSFFFTDRGQLKVLDRKDRDPESSILMYVESFVCGTGTGIGVMQGVQGIFTINIVFLPTAE